MTPIKDAVFSGSGGSGPDVPDGEDPVERLRQLRRGTEAAAASLPEEHEGLGRRAVEAARSTEAAATRNGRADEQSAREASSRLARLHFALVRLSVEEEASEQDVEEAIRALGSPGGGGAPVS